MTGFYIIITFSDYSDTLPDDDDGGGGGKPSESKFKLRFQNERTEKYPKMIPTKILTRHESTNVSFPESNAVNYTNNSTQLTFISPETGKPFNLSVTFRDIEKVADFVKWFSIEDKGGVSSTTTFKYKDVLVSSY